MNAETPANRLFLVDGSGYIFRAFHALPPMTRADGVPINAVYGFCNMLMKLLDDMDADAIAVVFDKSGQSFRNDLFDSYKANRGEAPDELAPQFPLVRDAVRAFNLPCIEMDGYEADDIIATYACQAQARGTEVTIVSSDKDLMQLVGDRIRMYDPMKQKSIGPDEVRERFGVGPDLVIDVQALAGDSVDNVPGVPGIGVKTGAQLISEFGSLDALLARASEIKQPKRRENLLAFADQARLSRELVRLKLDVPVPVPLDEFAVRRPDPETLVGFLKAQGFRGITVRAERKLADAATPVPAAAAITIPAEVRADYELILDADRLRHWVTRAVEKGALAVTTKVTHVDPLQARLCGIAMSVEAGCACYVPVGNAGPAAQLSLEQQALSHATVLEILRPLLEDPSVLKIGHDVKREIRVLRRQGVALAPADDIGLLSYLLDGTLVGLTVADLARHHFDHGCIPIEEVVGKGKNAVPFHDVALDRALAHAAEEVDYLGRIHRVLKGRLVLERMVSVYETIERPLSHVLAGMEDAGVRIDPDQLRAMSRDFTQRLAGLEDEIFKLAGRTFNIGSPKQLSDVLSIELADRGTKKTKTGAFATGADVLDELAAQGNELAARVLEWRQIEKLKSTYTDALQEEINPGTGRVHTRFAMTVTSTGRLSSTEPNLQNIPIRTEEGSKIRQAFVAANGMQLLSADYSQIELRLLAHVAEIEPLRQAFHQGYDIHATTASQVFGMPVDQVDPLSRRKAKTINFGIIYGISAFGLARRLGIPQGEAKTYIDAYFTRFAGIRDYMERCKEFARRNGFVTTIFGRKCYTPHIQDRNPARRSFAERAAINAPLQGAAADIIKRAMVRVPRALERRKLGARMLLTVHDELLFEVPAAEVPETSAVIREIMESAAKLAVPLVVETGVADNWAGAH